MSTALGIFVKTPGLSPVKTRLAASRGQTFAEEFFALSLDATESLVRACMASHAGLEAYWAVAESQAMSHPRWSELPRLAQGEGSLGERLDRVYRELGRDGRRVILIGADSPQLRPAHLEAALACDDDAFIGPALDGGYYLFCGRKPIARELWTAVPYSEDRTAREFARLLQLQGSVAFGEPVGDVDEEADLLSLVRDLEGIELRSSAQSRLLDWLRRSSRR